MISIIICSIKPDLLVKFEENIAATIGVEYEIIAIDNRESNKGICEIYNAGLAQSKFDTVCFCHEDIAVETIDWGRRIINLLASNLEIGLVGVTGAVYKSQYPNPWPALPSMYYRSNLIQQKKDSVVYNPQLNDSVYSEVAVIDGCFIAGSRKTFELFEWNEDLLKGFHLYDIDISLRVGQHFKIVVSDAIKITHFSEGNMDAKWLEQSELFHKANRIKLPKAVIDLSRSEMLELEYFSLTAYILRLIALRQSKGKIIKFYVQLFFLQPFKLTTLSVFKKVMLFVLFNK